MEIDERWLIRTNLYGVTGIVTLKERYGHFHRQQQKATYKGFSKMNATIKKISYMRIKWNGTTESVVWGIIEWATTLWICDFYCTHCYWTTSINVCPMHTLYENNIPRFVMFTTREWGLLSSVLDIMSFK